MLAVKYSGISFERFKFVKNKFDGTFFIGDFST